MAEQHFHEINSDFIPQEDWKTQYFRTIQNNMRFRLNWIVTGGEKVGFVFYGTEKHRCLPRVSGVIYEMYIRPEHRRRGYAKQCALLVIEELKKNNPSKIQLEIMFGDRAANALWTGLGFKKVSERMVLHQQKQS